MEAAALAGQVGSSGQNDVVVVRDLAVVGGVAANQAVRAALKGICESRDPPWRLVRCCAGARSLSKPVS